jgi:hypothetical protein
MVHLIQLEVTNFYCSADEFADIEFHIDRLWRSSLFLFKVKAFRLMYHYARAQSAIIASNLPPEWFAFGQSLPVSHVFNKATFRMILMARNQSVEELQRVGYTELSIHEIELFDQSTIEEYLKSTFTVNELVLAAGQVNLAQPI